MAQASVPEPDSRHLELIARFLTTYPSGAHAADARFAMAETLFRQARYEEAKPYYQMLSSKKSGAYAEDALLRLGEIAYNSKRCNDAERAWKQLEKVASKESPLLAEAWYGQALCEIQRQDYFQATRTTDRLVSKFPVYGSLAKARELLGILRMKEKRFAEAIKLLEGVESPTGALYRGLSYYYSEQYLEAAGAFDRLEQLTASNGAYAEMGAYFKAE
jgi:TolA-binding protein